MQAPGLLIAFLSLSCAAVADAQGDRLPELLESITRQIEFAVPAGKPGPRSISFSYNPDFPCMVTLTERYQREGATWRRRYVFDLTEMQSDQLFRSRERRRAITYYATVQYADGGKQEFQPKKIAGFQLPFPDHHLRKPVSEAIGICRGRNDFQ